MQEKKHQLSDYQLKIIDKVKKSKENEQRGNFLILEQSKQKFIFEADITPTSKLLLIYFLSKLDFCHKHLYIHASYKIIEKETTIIKSTIMRSIKELQEKGFIKLLSGKKQNRKYHYKGVYLCSKATHPYDFAHNPNDQQFILDIVSNKINSLYNE